MSKIERWVPVTVSLFSLISFDFWSVLMTHLLLHKILHLFIYDAAKKTVSPLTSCSTKNSNRDTVNNYSHLRLSSITWRQEATTERVTGSLALAQLAIYSDTAWRITSPPRPRSLFPACRVIVSKAELFKAVLQIRIRIRIRTLLGIMNPDPLIIVMDPDPDSSIIKQK
jgi:hypothetical protein